jgi:hypothetical protein
VLLFIASTHRVIVGFLIECRVGVSVAHVSDLLFERPFIAARRRAYGTNGAVSAPQA